MMWQIAVAFLILFLALPWGPFGEVWNGPIWVVLLLGFLYVGVALWFMLNLYRLITDVEEEE